MLSENIRTSIRSALHSSRDELNALLQRLIQIQSYSGDEGEIVEFIRQKMIEYGFDEARIDGFGNIIGRLGNGPVTILFDAHIDTVKVTDDEVWQYPAFDGKIVNGEIHGRGAVDEKPAMAGFLMAVKLLKEKFPDDFPFTLYVVGSVLEEDVDGYPLLHLIQNEGIKPDYVLLGEPTDLQVYRGQRGRMEFKITTTGKSAHGAHNHQGVNAVYKMQPIIAAIEKLDRRLPLIEPLGKGSITVSQIISKAPSLCSVPDFCQIHIDRRLTLNETQDSATAELQSILAETGIDATVSIPVYKGISWKHTEFQQHAYFPTWIYDEEHPLVQAGVQAANLSIDKPAKTGVWKFSTNGVATAGHLNIPTIGFAPGKEELSHSSHEVLNLDDLFQATLFYSYFPYELI